MSRKFTMSYQEAVRMGVDYRDYPKVQRLQKGILIKPIAGIWGDYTNIRCLFVDLDGGKWRRHLVRSEGIYLLPELELEVREILLDSIYRVEF